MPEPSSPSVLAGFSADAGNPRRVARALADVAEGCAQWRLAWSLAKLDLRNRYRGSVLGPLWLTLSTGVMLAGIGLLYSALLRVELRDYLPHLAVSLVVWQWIATSVNDACASLSSADGVIRQLRLPYTVHALRTAFRNMAVAAHSLPLILVVFAMFGHVPGPEGWLALVGAALVAFNAAIAGLSLGMLCARFRDLQQIVANAVQLAFFLSPVLWKPELLGPGAEWMVLNPFYALLDTVRGPLIAGGGWVWAWVAAVAYTAAHAALAAFLFVRFRARIAFWV